MAACVWNGRGGACVPARTSAQRRFHPRIMHFHVQTLCFRPSPDAPNDGCALAGRAGRHTGTAPTTLDGHFGRVPAKPFII